MTNTMFILNLHDRNGTALNLGDIVRISDGRVWTFFAEVKYLHEEKVITPFHTFSFHSFEKVDAVPEIAVKSTEDRYNIWYIYHNDAETDNSAELAERYLMSWRQCEHLLKNRCFSIELNEAI